MLDLIRAIMITVGYLKKLSSLGPALPLGEILLIFHLISSFYPITSHLITSHLTTSHLITSHSIVGEESDYAYVISSLNGIANGIPNLDSPF